MKQLIKNIKWNASIADFKKGDTVVYVPKLKQDNPTHEDCEPGRVISINDKFVFVDFNIRGEYFNKPQACSPNDLKHRI